MRANAKLKLELFATFGLAALCLWIAIGWMLHRAHEQAIAVAAADRQNLARSLAEYEESSVRAIDLSLRVLRDEWQRAPGSFDAAVARYEEYLKKENVIQVSVANRDGFMVYSRLPQQVPGSFADREYFQVQKKRSIDQLHISEPIMGRVTKQWAIQMTRPLLDAAGRFNGLLIVAVPPPGLELVYGDLHLGRDGLIALAREDGQILALTGGVARAPRRSLEGMSGLDPRGPASGEFRAVSADGVERFYSYRRLSSYPLTVYVAQAIGEVFAPYYEQRTLLLAGGALGTLMLAALAALAVSRALQRRRFLDERERLMLDLHDSCIQSIYAIGLGLESCRRLIDREPRRAGDALAEAGANLNLVIQDLRAFITGGEAPPRDEGELAAELTRGLPPGEGPALSFDIEPAALQALNADQGLHVRRIAREALSNVVRHANAKSARLSLALRGGRIHLDVSDDGRGLAPGGEAHPGLGLHHIRARAQKLGGKARIESAPAGGTRVAVEFPSRP
ncbi:MAG TPA: ATP-binding protein [Burkholderiales bacterium]|nr:ATP-binding protein [Burkholderiales bacterium]